MLQDRVNVLVPCGVIRIFQVGTRIEQLFEDLQMIASRFVDGRPDSRSECCAAVHASGFERSLCADEEPHRFQLSTIRSPLRASNPVPAPPEGLTPWFNKYSATLVRPRKLAHVNASASAFG